MDLLFDPAETPAGAKRCWLQGYREHEKVCKAFAAGGRASVAVPVHFVPLSCKNLEAARHWSATCSKIPVRGPSCHRIFPLFSRVD